MDATFTAECQSSAPKVLATRCNCSYDGFIADTV